jgi:dTDP-glucose pyrophosphorylase
VNHYTRHLIPQSSSVKQAMIQLDSLATDAILFIVDEENRLCGSMTDGDLRRGFIKGLTFDDALPDFVQPQPKHIRQGDYNLQKIIELRKKNYTIFPVIDKSDKVINVVNFRHQKSYLPVDALIMAGGRGERLRPLTDELPKPLLPVGDKPIIEHNINRLRNFGIDDVWISVKYLGEKIKAHFGDGNERSMRIKYVEENEPLGTIGALSLVNDLVHENLLVMNSDLLTTIDFEDFYLFFQTHQADLAVACIPYNVSIPYAVMETKDYLVTGFKEKPRYTHYSNAGIYLMNNSVRRYIPSGQVFNATDLMDKLIKEGKKVVAYHLLGYWLDIGKPEDYTKAQEDILHLNL